MTDITAKLAEALKMAETLISHLVVNAADSRDIYAGRRKIERALRDYRQHTEAQAGGTEGVSEALRSVLDEMDDNEGHCSIETYDKARSALAAAPAERRPLTDEDIKLKSQSHGVDSELWHLGYECGLREAEEHHGIGTAGTTEQAKEQT